MTLKIAVTVATTIIVLSCSTEKQTPPAAGNFINPNGSSELAVLMNELFMEAETAKQKIALGEKPNWKVDAKKILSAVATEPEKVASPEYKAFAASYIESVKMLKKCSPAEAPERFKMMATACMNCHNALCPGPRKRIKKLF